MIDLDRPTAAPPAVAARPRSRGALTALALLLAGGAIGGVAVDRYQQQRADDRRQSAVTLVLVTDPLQRPDDGAAVTSRQDNQVLTVGLTGHADVINAGPAPVRFAGLQAVPPGLQMRGEPWSAANPAIPPGGMTVATVHATVRCGSDALTEPLPATVEVVTADGVKRRPAVTFDARAWVDKVEGLCGQTWIRSLARRVGSGQ